MEEDEYERLGTNLFNLKIISKLMHLFSLSLSTCPHNALEFHLKLVPVFLMCSLNQGCIKFRIPKAEERGDFSDGVAGVCSSIYLSLYTYIY